MMIFLKVYAVLYAIFFFGINGYMLYGLKKEKSEMDYFVVQA